MFRKLASSLVMSCVAVNTAFAQVVHPEGECIYPNGSDVEIRNNYPLQWVWGYDKSNPSELEQYGYWFGSYDINVQAKNINGMIWRGMDEMIINYTDESGLDSVRVPLANTTGTGGHNPLAYLTEPTDVVHEGYTPNSGPMLWCDGRISRHMCINHLFENNGRTNHVRGFMEFRRQYASGFRRYMSGRMRVRANFWVYVNIDDIPNVQHMKNVGIELKAVCFQGCTFGNEYREGLNECTGFEPVD